MLKTVLIPTDFSIESLNAVKMFLLGADKQYKYNVILLHGIDATDSITDAMYFSKSTFIKGIEGKDFSDACMIIKNKFADHINSIRKDIFSGFTQAAFNNYVEANKVDEIYIPTNYSMNFIDKRSFDILPYIKKSNVHINEIAWIANDNLPEKGQLAEVFVTNMQTA